MPIDPLDAEQLRQITNEMIVAITTPAFVEAMRTMKDTPVDQRVQVASQILTPEALRSKGVPLPSHMRITSRYFEVGKPTVEVVDTGETGTSPEAYEIKSVSFRPKSGGPLAGGCACGGAGTVCGGAGN